MRATVSVIALLLTFLVGCSDQSQLTGPTSTSNHSAAVLAKSSDVFTVDTKVIGPGGLKYSVVGTIEYILKNEGEIILLTTNMALRVAQSGLDEEQKVSGGNAFSLISEPGKTDLVSESHAIEYVAENSHRVWIQYSIADNEVNLADIRIISGDPD